MLDRTTARLFVVRLIPVAFHPPILKAANTIANAMGGQRFQQMMFSPTWHVIQRGPGKGTQLFMDNSGGLASEMIQGTYDEYFFEAVKKKKPEGKVIFDVGAHIGYDTLIFAKMVRKKGRVIAFEPNPFNRERLELNLSQNTQLADRVIVHDVALSDTEGIVDFLMTNMVDGWASSGSFLDTAHTNMEHDKYEKELGFQRTKTTVTTIDAYVKKHKVKPDVIKIDVEGAEQEVIRGAMRTLKNTKPVLYIELHSIFSTLQVTQLLTQLKYHFTILKEEKDGRCFIEAA
jgi:FkbM family methyltransferase